MKLRSGFPGNTGPPYKETFNVKDFKLDCVADRLCNGRLGSVAFGWPAIAISAGWSAFLHDGSDGGPYCWLKADDDLPIQTKQWRTIGELQRNNAPNWA
jgi:hypothetical protein